MEFVSIEELVPRDHLLRKIDTVIDFGFIRNRVKDLCSAVLSSFTSLHELLENIEKFIFKNINALAKENPA